MPDPYISKQPNDLIKAADWNQIQIDARTEIEANNALALTHDHTGGDMGVQLGTDAIADGAVTMAKLAEDVSVGVADGSVGTTQLADSAVTMAKFAQDVLDRLAEITQIANQALSLAQQAMNNSSGASTTANEALTKGKIALKLAYTLHGQAAKDITSPPNSGTGTSTTPDNDDGGIIRDDGGLLDGGLLDGGTIKDGGTIDSPPIVPDDGTLLDK